MNALRKNSAGIITCHYDFTDTGFIDALCKKLSFDVIGMTTMASANRYGHNMYALSLTVLTSDEVAFETALTVPLSTGNYREEIAAAYTGAAQKLGGEPSMIIAFFPYHKDLGGALQVRTLDEICSGVPIWGGLATNLEASYEKCGAFRNGASSQDVLAMLLMRGPVNPEFVTISMPEEKIRESRGIITDSDGRILKKINGIPALKYLEGLGITILENASYITPLMVYYEGASEPVALGIYSVDEDGSVLCGGEMTSGGAISVGEVTAEGIIATAGAGVNRILQSGKKDGALMLPCISRYAMLAPKQADEMELVTRRMSEADMPFMLAYVGGEVCPVRDDSGKPRNRFHNHTFSACAF
jgi:hypothetical protein